jgi:nitroimidazol reductase NimA-like FMN-containing flavoprotein (pyridoxamine 5'-phosphate oxidase superfamily)
MLGALTASETEQLLRRQTVGRIGCHAEGRTYVVPITYAYDGACVIARSADGLKIRTMRANPSVCFEVDEVIDPAHWSSVVAQGSYEELSGEDEERADVFLCCRLGATATSETALRRSELAGIAEPHARTTLFRIRLNEMTGRFER